MCRLNRTTFVLFVVRLFCTVEQRWEDLHHAILRCYYIQIECNSDNVLDGILHAHACRLTLFLFCYSYHGVG